MKVTAKIVSGSIRVNANIVSMVPVQAQLVSVIRVSTAEDYTGDYEVDSFCTEPLLTTSLVLPTADKHMLRDVTVYSIPTREERDESGGVAFIIGG